jgi:acetyltransferase-like isoleucine patch superfamily enzyme
MNVFIYQQAQTLGPLQTPVSDLSIGDETVLQRLKRQFSIFSPKVLDQQFNRERIDHKGIHLSAQLYLSDDLAKDMIKQCQTSHDESLEFEIDPIDQMALSTSPKDWKTLNFYYQSESGQKRTIRLPGQTFKYYTNLPQSVYGDADIYVPFCYRVGINLEQWPDLLNMYISFAKRHSAKRVKLLRKVMSDRMIHKIFDHHFFSSRGNKIGKNCKIHPTAVIEGSVIEDGVEIGPHCYIRSSYIGHQSIIREHSALKLAYLDRGVYMMTCDVFNSFIGAHSSILTFMLYNVYLADEVFIGGASGFSDFQFFQDEVKEGQRFLGSIVGEKTKIGAGLLFKAGREIPANSTILNTEMIEEVPSHQGMAYIKSKNKLIGIPPNFIQ